MLNKLFIALLFLISSPQILSGNTIRYHLSIAAVFQNEAKYLKEWIEFHRLVGVEHFYLYNNESTDDFITVLQPYLKEGIVELYDWPNRWPERPFYELCQPNAYRHALRKARKTSKWLAIIDTDEFVFPTEGGSLAKYLDKHYKHNCGVCVNWQCYGTSNLSLKNDELLTEMLVLKAPVDHHKNTYFKSIVQPQQVQDCPNVHACTYKNGRYAVDTHKIKEPGRKFIHIDRLRINHYWFRDLDFLINVKTPRIKAWGGPYEILLLADQAFNVVEDKAIHIYLKDLKKRMGR